MEDLKIGSFGSASPFGEMSSVIACGGKTMLTILKLAVSARRFAKNNSGAVTVDWVALTAAVVIIGIGIVYAVFGSGDDGVNGLVTNLTAELGTAASNIEDGVGALPTGGAEGGEGGGEGE